MLKFQHQIIYESPSSGCFGNKQEETEWLDRMGADGWCLTAVTGSCPERTYYFTKQAPE